MSRSAGDRDDGRTSDYRTARSAGRRPCGNSSCRTAGNRPGCSWGARRGSNPSCRRPGGRRRRSCGRGSTLEPVLQPQVVDAAQGFLEDLRPHDGRADREDDAALEACERAAEELEVGLGGAADRGAAEDRVIGDDVVADAGMDGERDVVASGLGEDRGVFPAVADGDPSRRASACSSHRSQQIGAGGRERMRGLGGDQRRRARPAVGSVVPSSRMNRPSAWP